MPTKTCATCGDEFDVIKSRADDAQFCSTDCYHEGQKKGLTAHKERRVEYVEKTCKQCGEGYSMPPSRSDREFCGQECYHEWSSSYQRDQNGKRARYRERENRECEICGFDRVVELAHIVPARLGGDYSKNNILFLCANHHELFDSYSLTRDELREIESSLDALRMVTYEREMFVEEGT